ncbi:MAG: hypothetical protein RLN89_07860 [Parvibaculum sp.]
MSVFAVKMLTLLGYILYAGGPVDAVSLAMGSTGGQYVGGVPGAGVPGHVECVIGCTTGMVASSVAGPVRMARLVLTDEGLADEAKMPLLRSSTLDFEGEDFGSEGWDRTEIGSGQRLRVVNLGRVSARSMGTVE